MKKPQASLTSAGTLMTSTISWSKAVLAIGLLVLALTSLAQGGCSRFGHSCFGAHGKRSDGDLERPLDLSDPMATGVILPAPESGRFPDYDFGRRRMSPYLRDLILGARREGSFEENRSKDFLTAAAGGDRDQQRRK